MPIDSRFLSMMPTTITVRKRSGINQYGAVSWSGGTDYRCRIMDEESLVRTAEGDNVTIVGRAIIYGVADVTTDDLLVLPDGVEPVIVQVDQVTDEDGPHHTVIKFGR